MRLEVMQVGIFDMISYPAEKAGESDLILARTIQKWAENEVMARRLEFREDYELLLKPALHKLLVEMELQKLLWPEDCGGIGLNKPETALTMTLALEQVGRADTSLGYLVAVTTALYSSFTLEENFDHQLCLRLAPLLGLNDEIALGSLILPSYGGEGLQQESGQHRGKYIYAGALRDGDNWIINGSALRPLCSGLDAKIFGILCAVENDDQAALILVPADSKGLKRGEPIIEAGLAANNNAEINLEAVSVPAENMVFQGDKHLQRMLSWFHLNVSAVTVGSLFAVFEIIREWGDTRVIKGRGNLFKENPLTASVMAEISHDILISRLLLHQLASIIANPEYYREEGEEKLFIQALSVSSQTTRSAEKAINRAMELMGSAGYATEWNLERYWRDIKTIQGYLGSRELNNMELARFFFQTRTL